VQAAAAGVSTLAVTDHDTLDGLQEALAAGPAAGVRVICGIELSIKRPGGRLHLLAYLGEPAPEPLAGTVAELRAVRERRARRMLARLAERGVEVPFEAVARQAGGPIGRPHIAAVMVQLGFVATLQEAFDRFLADDRPVSEPAGTLGAEEAIRLVRASGGVPVLAHPFTLQLAPEALRAELEAWCDAGLAGIEAYRPDHDAGMREAVLALASQLGLVATGGSDFHRPEPGQAIGWLGDRALPPETLAALGIPAY
jgi:predicted metal-dependent phosphoesterase TrpH